VSTRAASEERAGEMSDRTRVRLALAVVAACVASAALYAVLRIVQKLLFSEPDPALVVWSAHAGFFWRAWTSVYGGGMLGFVAWVAAGRDATRTARVLATALVVAALLIVAQGVLIP
jgi:hypothetical protein